MNNQDPKENYGVDKLIKKNKEKNMKIEIKHKISGAVLFSCEAEDMKIAVKLAIEARADLRNADLCYADLSYANLRNADLSYADLSYANLRNTNLCYADLRYADLCYADLRNANLRYADLSYADPSYADLSYANLGYADLRNTNLDYACWPLWCGSKKVKVDVKIAAQIAAHFCALDCEDKEYLEAKKAILKFATTSHRAVDFGIKKGR